MSQYENLIPEPVQMRRGKEGNFCILSGDWKFITNCPSKRIIHHIERVKEERNSLKNGNGNLSYTKNSEESSNLIAPDFEQTLISYPLGKVSPRNPFYILLSPEELNVSGQVLLSRIKWLNPWNALDYRSADEYHLTIGQFIQISARCERGLFYGLQTLIHLIRGTSNQIPYITIDDNPKLSVRGIHIDLKAQCPNVEYLKMQVRLLASYKINTLLIEWEDKFPFVGKLEILRHPAALTAEDRDSWLEECYLYYMETIPLIQSLGHLEYILKKPEFQILAEMHEIECNSPREKQLKYQMICPTSEKAKDLIKAVHAQIIFGMGKHTACRFVHLGMDETFSLGKCPRCQVILKNDPNRGKSKLFADHLNWIAEFHKKNNKTSIVWGDMLIKEPQSISQLDSSIIIHDWDYYHPIPMGNKTLHNNIENIDSSGRSVDWITMGKPITFTEIKTNPPHNSERFLGSYWTILHQKYPLRAFPYQKYFKDAGFKVLAAPAVQCCHQSPIFPFYPVRFLNILYSDINAIGNGISGSICTNWVIRGSMWSLLQYGFLEHAEVSWSGITIKQENFAPKYWKSLFFDGGDSNLNNMILMLANLHTDLGYFAADFPALVSAFTTDSRTRYRHIDRDYLQNTIFPNISEYLDRIKAMQQKVARNTLIFDSYLISLRYYLLLRDYLLLTPSLIKIGLDLDSGENIHLPKLEDLEKYRSQIEEYKNSIERLELEFIEIFGQILNPEEINSSISVRFAELKEQINIYHDALTPLVRDLSQFSEKIVNNCMKYYK